MARPANSVKKVCGIIAAAAEHKADIVTFAEAFIPGYPAWIWYSFPCLVLHPGMADPFLGLALLIQLSRHSISKTHSRWIPRRCR